MYTKYAIKHIYCTVQHKWKKCVCVWSRYKVQFCFYSPKHCKQNETLSFTFSFSDLIESIVTTFAISEHTKTKLKNTAFHYVHIRREKCIRESQNSGQKPNILITELFFIRTRLDVAFKMWLKAFFVFFSFYWNHLCAFQHTVYK